MSADTEGYNFTAVLLEYLSALHSNMRCWEDLLSRPEYLPWQSQQLPIIDILNYFTQQIWEASTVEILWPRTRNNGPTSIEWPGLRAIVESGNMETKHKEKSR